MILAKYTEPYTYLDLNVTHTPYKVAIVWSVFLSSVEIANVVIRADTC